jgi:phosphoesterase RecJ-like protein
MQKKGTRGSIWSLFLKSRTILLTTHVRPDGDGLASELALCHILTAMGKEVRIVNQDKTPEMYKWLPGADTIVSLDNGDSSPETGPIEGVDLAVILDCSSRERIGNAYERIRNAKRIISLDHHEDSECFRDSCFIDTGASSIGELIYFLVPDVRSRLTREIATCIYASIMTDTGSFAYSNTTPRVFDVVSNLLEFGVQADSVFRKTYYNKRINHFRLLARALSLLRTDETKKIAYVLLPASVYRRTGATEEDNEGILEVLRGMSGIELIIMLRQIEGNRVKGSLRSLSSVNCNHLAKLFGGGGHPKASGFVVAGDVRAIGRSIVKTIIEKVRDLGWIAAV